MNYKNKNYLIKIITPCPVKGRAREGFVS